MRLLLDTHVWIQSAESPLGLNARIRRELVRSTNELYLSPVSIWEAQQLVRRNRVRLKRGFREWLEVVFERTPIREAPFTFQVAKEATSIHLPQPDPGDLFLAATAIVYDLTLVTADPQLLELKGLKTLAA